TGGVAVNGGTLGGKGSISGNVTVGTATLAPGDNFGTLTLGGTTTLAATSTFSVHLNGTTAGTNYDQLVIASGGSLNLGSALLTGSLGYTPAATDKLFIVNNQNTSGGLSGTFAGVPQDGQTIIGGYFANVSYVGDFGSGSLVGGNDVVVYNFTPAPEPAYMLALCAAVLGLGSLYGRRRRQAA